MSRGHPSKATPVRQGCLLVVVCYTNAVFIMKAMSDEKIRKCMKCKKEKLISDGTVRLAGLAFCCKECCGADGHGDQKEGSDGKKPNVCEFC